MTTHGFSFFKKCIYAFYKPSVYRNCSTHEKGLQLRFLLKLSFLFHCITLTPWLIHINAIDHKQFSATLYGILFPYEDISTEESLNRLLSISHEIPEITLTEHRLSFTNSGTTIIIDPVSQKPLATFDPQEQFTQTTSPSALLIQPRAIYNHSQDNSAEYSFRTHPNLISSEKDYLNYFLHLVKQIPNMQLTNGTLSLEDTTPHYISDWNGTRLITIDTTRVDAETGTLLTLTQHDIILASGEKIAYADINYDGIRSALTHLTKTGKTLAQTALILVILPLMTIFTFALLSVITAIAALLTQSLFQWRISRTIDYHNAFRLTALAMTPALILNTLFPSVILNQGLVYLIVLVGYIFFGVNANRNDHA